MQNFIGRLGLCKRLIQLVYKDTGKLTNNKGCVAVSYKLLGTCEVNVSTIFFLELYVDMNWLCLV